jgi:Ribulose kinase
VLPEFLGNRSPHADPSARAVIAGLDLDCDLDSLERLFVSGLCGLAYGLADVVDVMRAHAIPCRMMVISGGASRSPLVRQIMADTTGLTVAAAGDAGTGAARRGHVGASPAERSPPSRRHAGDVPARAGDAGDGAGDDPAFTSAKRRVYALMRQFEKESRTAMQAHGGCLPAATEDTAQCC